MSERVRYEIEITDPTQPTDKVHSSMMWLRVEAPGPYRSAGFNWFSINENYVLISGDTVTLTGEMTDGSCVNGDRHDAVLVTLQDMFPNATITTRWLVIDDDVWDDVCTTSPSKEKS